MEAAGEDEDEEEEVEQAEGVSGQEGGQQAPLRLAILGQPNVVSCPSFALPSVCNATNRLLVWQKGGWAICVAD